MKKQFVVTDPCYILPSEVWSKCLASCDEFKNDSAWAEMFRVAVEKALKEYTQGQAFVCDTGYGDWSNEIVAGPVLARSFGADSGMVCVCEYVGKVFKALGEGRSVDRGLAALFEAEGPITVDFDTSYSSWTVVYIEDASGTQWNTLLPEDYVYDDEEW